MTKKWIRVCYLCYNDGNLTKATYFYMATNEKTFDVCDIHAIICKEEGRKVYPIMDATEVEGEVWW